MAFPPKNYHRLQSLQNTWNAPQEDMWYVMEEGLLRACVWLPLRCMDRIAMRDGKLIYEPHKHTQGFVGVRPEDCRHIFNTGSASLRIFHSVQDESHMLRMSDEPPQPSIFVTLNDLVILDEDRIKFEKAHDISTSNIHELQASEPVFVASDDCRYVKYKDLEFHFGDVQAGIVQQLYHAALSRNPMVHSKTLFRGVCSEGRRIRDVFKSKPNWKKLIASDGNGYYRLNVPMEVLAKSSKIIADLDEKSIKHA